MRLQKNINSPWKKYEGVRAIGCIALHDIHTGEIYGGLHSVGNTTVHYIPAALRKEIKPIMKAMCKMSMEDSRKARRDASEL